MRLLGNNIWIIFWGLIAAALYFIAGVILYITIIGIPFGRQAFKMARLVLAPFGTEVKTNFEKHPIANTLWLIFFGLGIALSHLVTGVIFCITIIGIPFGLQWFKLAKLALIPFGANLK